MGITRCTQVPVRYIDLFQSPFGDSMGITYIGTPRQRRKAFQSPFGDSMGITLLHDVGVYAFSFQSPFGDSMGITMPGRFIELCPGMFQSPFGDSMGITCEDPVLALMQLGFNPLSGIPWG